MTAAEFRKLALRIPEAVEAAHMNHPDFRVGGKIFATLTANNEQGMVKLTPQQQASFVSAQPEVFVPASGAWGRSGCTMVELKVAKKSLVKEALQLAWRNIVQAERVRTKKRGTKRD